MKNCGRERKRKRRGTKYFMDFSINSTFDNRSLTNNNNNTSIQRHPEKSSHVIPFAIRIHCYYGIYEISLVFSIKDAFIHTGFNPSILKLSASFSLSPPLFCPKHRHAHMRTRIILFTANFDWN